MRHLAGRLVPPTLRGRIMLALLSLVAALGALALIRATSDITNLLEDELQQRGLAIAWTVAARGRDTTVTNDLISIHSVVNDSLLNHPDVAYIFVREPDGAIPVHTLGAQVPSALVTANAVEAGSRESVRVLRTTDGPVIDVAVPLSAAGGVVRVGMSEARVRHQVVTRVSRLGLLVLIVGLVAVGAAFALSSVLTRPLVRLTEAAGRVGGGDLRAKVPVGSTDELGALAQAFNAMTDDLSASRGELEQRNEELRILNATGDFLSRHLSAADLPQRALEHVLALTDAGRGWICVRDPDAGMLLLAAAGLPPTRPGAGRIAPDACPCRPVFASGKPAVLTEGDPCPLFGDGGAAAAGDHRAVLPIFSRAGILGALVVARPDGFPRAQVQLLAAVARQVGVALENAMLYHAVQQKEEMRGQLLQKLIHAQEEERTRVAREIHDEPSQALSSVMMRLDQLERHLPDDERAQRAEVAAAQQSVRRAIDSLSRIMAELRPQILDDLGLLPAIRWCADERLRSRGVAVELQVPRPLPRMANDVEATIFRITQEAITNVAKHAEARTVGILLEMRADGLHGSIQDDGQGFDTAGQQRTGLHGQSPDSHGLGLVGMEERVRLLGGRLAVESQPGVGTRVAFTIPIAPAPVASHA